MADMEHPGYESTKDDVLKRLRRIEGQARGLQRMVEEDQYCIDILTQVSATTKALQAVALGLLDDHLAHCVRDAVDSGRRRRREALRGLGRDRPAGALMTTETMTQTWTVSGLSCAHCVASVTDEVSGLPGVTRVAVLLHNGALTVEAEPPLSDDDVEAAVEEAGYRLV